MSSPVRPIRMQPAVLLTALALFSTHAMATATFHVNDNNDLVDDNLTDGICHTSAGTCTLRAAIMQANHTDDDSLIVVPTGSYDLGIAVTGDDGEQEGDFNFTATDSDAPIVIVGAGIGQTAINGGTAFRDMHIEAGRHVSISGINITGGRTFTGNGGDILNEGTLAVDHSIVQSANGTEGGAIYNSGTLTLDHTTVANAGGSGGGIRNIASLTLVDSTVMNNNGHGAGGIWSSDGDDTIASVTAIRTTITGNSGDVGGFCCSGDLTLVDSTVAGNFSNSVGGGILFNAETSRVNTALLYNTTVVDNSAATAGSGIASSGDILTVTNSLIARNLRGDGTQEQDCGGTIIAAARNVFGSTDECAISGDTGGVSLLNSLDSLGMLADNGGPTKTIALLSGSNAIDAGDPAGCVDADSAPLLVDQRGYPRPIGAACDVGAYEFGSTDPDIIFIDGFDPAM
jgi:hypothetical protein